MIKANVFVSTLLYGSFAANAAVLLDCPPNHCMTANLFCHAISSADCAETDGLCYFPDAHNPAYCTDTKYSKVAGHAVKGKSISCNDQSSRLYYQKPGECMDTCDSCVGCVGFVDNHDRSKPYCVFKSSEETLYAKSSKNYYRGEFSLIRNAAVSGNSVRCNGNTKLYYGSDREKCTAMCNRCDTCVGYVDNRDSAYCVFKGSEATIYTNGAKDYYRQDTTFLKRLSMDALEQVLLEQYELLSKEDQANTRFEDVVELSYQLVRGEDFIEYDHRNLRPAFDTDDECLMALATVAIDAVGVVFQFLGISELQSRAAARSMLAELSPEVLYGLRATVHDLSIATSTYDKASLIYSIFGQIKNAVGYQGIKQALAHSMHTLDYVVMSVTIIAQLTAWFATDGAAVIAEMTLAGAMLTTTVLDSVHAAQAC